MQRLFHWLIDVFKVYKLESTIYCYVTRQHQDIIDNFLLTDGRRIWVLYKNSFSNRGIETRVTVYVKGRKLHKWAHWRFYQAIYEIDKLLQEEDV